MTRLDMHNTCLPSSGLSALRRLEHLSMCHYDADEIVDQAGMQALAVALQALTALTCLVSMRRPWFCSTACRRCC